MMFLDIETTGYRADSSRIVTIGITLPDGKRNFLFANSSKEEKEIILQALDLLLKNKGEKIVIWYSKFDIPFIVSRAVLHGIDVSAIYEFEIIDLWELIKKNLNFSSNKLEDVAKNFGIKRDFFVSGKHVSNLFNLALEGDLEAKEKIIMHCEDDLQALEAIYEKVKSYVDVWQGKKNK